MKRFLLFFGILFGSIFIYLLSNLIFSPTLIVTAADNPVPQLSQSNTTECAIRSGYPDQVRLWCSLITKYAQDHALDPNLIAALIWQESGGNPEIISRDGAVGLMQVMPSDGKAAEFMCINGPCFANRPTTAELKDPEFNIAWGIMYLSQLQKNYGNLRDALKSYGPANVDYYYADKVIAIYQSY